MRKFALVLLASILLFSLALQPAWSQRRLERFKLGYDGVPLKYERVFDYEHPYPKVDGLLVKWAEQSDPAVKAGLRVGNIITTVNDTPVETRHEIREIAIDNLGEELEFTVYQKTPRYEHRLREDPFYEPGSSSSYEQSSFTVTYDTPGLERNPVIAGPTKALYHKQHYDHSPDTRGNIVYLNPTKATKDGLNPCPVCFPSGEGGSIQNLLQKEIMGASSFVKNLTKGAPRIEDVPDEIRSMVDELSRHMLSRNKQTTVALFQDNSMYGFGLPNGEIILTYNLFRYAETDREQAAFLAHLIAHADRGHDHQPVEENQIRSLVERAIERTTGVNFKFEQLKEWSPAIPGFSYYNEILQEGYGDAQEREAIFYGLVYLYKQGYSLNGMKEWMGRKRDMLETLHPYWIDFCLAHPVPFYIEYDINRWSKLIPKNFKREHPPKKKE